MTNASDDKMEQGDVKARVFWLLKRLTSYSLWRQKRDAWAAFVIEFEQAIKQWAPDELKPVAIDLLPLAYDALKLYNDGLANLARGQRFVWKTGQPLYEAMSEAGTIFNNFYHHPEYWERGMQLQRYPAHIEGIMKLMLAARFHGEQSPLEIPADATYRGAYWPDPSSLLDPAAYDYGFYSLPYPVFPRTLPEPPSGTSTSISTGDNVPVDGIWEPVAVSRKRLLGLIPVGEENKGSGCYNYFVMGTAAPRISVYDEATKRANHVSSQWRLIWPDERYKDGVIGDESEYFPEPQSTRIEATPADPGEIMTNEI